jgi:hypothetical protein
MSQPAPRVRHVPITGDIWLNGDGRPQVKLVFPDGTDTILAVPHRNPAGEPDSGKAYRDVMAALAKATP